MIVKQVDEKTRSKTSINELLRGAAERRMTTLYGLDNCDTCKKARNWLERFGVEHAFVDYRDDRAVAGDAGRLGAAGSAAGTR